jgi:hypothetical protein
MEKPLSAPVVTKGLERSWTQQFQKPDLRPCKRLNAQLRSWTRRRTDREVRLQVRHAVTPLLVADVSLLMYRFQKPFQ